LQNLSVEMQVENLHEVSMDHFKAELEKAGGARYTYLPVILTWGWITSLEDII
jgi:hypothetical protein